MIGASRSSSARPVNQEGLNEGKSDQIGQAQSASDEAAQLREKLEAAEAKLFQYKQENRKLKKLNKMVAQEAIA